MICHVCWEQQRVLIYCHEFRRAVCIGCCKQKIAEVVPSTCETTGGPMAMEHHTVSLSAEDKAAVSRLGSLVVALNETIRSLKVSIENLVRTATKK